MAETERERLQREAREDPDAFWAREVSDLPWFAPWRAVLLADSPERGAAFGCVLYCIGPDGEVSVASGVLPGEITHEAAGADGFGYDPVVRPLTGDRTLAQMTRDEKAAISHRGRAARGMAHLLRLT